MGNCFGHPPTGKNHAEVYKEDLCIVKDQKNNQTGHKKDTLKDSKATEGLQKTEGGVDADEKEPDTSQDPYAASKAGHPYRPDLLGPPVPYCDEQRLATVKALNNVEAPPDPEIQSILNLVSSIFGCPNTLVALFGDKRVFVRQATGAFERGDFPWRSSFCAWTMMSPTDQVMVIPDATQDVRFAKNKFVCGVPGVRFYVGTPLIASNGHRLGTLCFADMKPGTFDASRATIFNNLAEMVVRQVEKDLLLQLRQRTNKQLEEGYTQLKRAIDCVESCVALVDVSVPGWRIVYANAAWESSVGFSREKAMNALVKDMLEISPDPTPNRSSSSSSSVVSSKTGRSSEQSSRRRDLPLPEHESAVNEGMPILIEGAILKGAPLPEDEEASTASTLGIKIGKRVTLNLRPAGKAVMDSSTLPIGVPSFVPRSEEKDQYYFMTIESDSRNKDSGSNVNARTTFYHMLPSGQSTASSSEIGLSFGAMIGRGSFGPVFSGQWYGTPVAIKVLEQELSADQRTTDKAALEAQYGVELRHPHVVSTLKVVLCRPSEAVENNAIECVGSSTGSSGSSRSKGGKKKKGQSGSGPQSANSMLKAINEDLSSPSEGDGPQTLTSEGDDVSKACKKLADLWPEADSGNMLEVDDSAGSGELMADNVASPQTWIIMEYCDKGHLQDAVDRGWLKHQRLPESPPKMDAVIASAYEIASALSFLHKNGVVHGDLSAYNVLLTCSGAGCDEGGRGFTAKVADFGRARTLDAKSRVMTKTYGTLTHQPPEAFNEGEVSRRTDVYSLGVILWQMVTGSRPWTGLTHTQIVMKVGQREMLKVPPWVPGAYAELTKACMAYDPDDRPELPVVVEKLEAMRPHGGHFAKGFVGVEEL